MSEPRDIERIFAAAIEIQNRAERAEYLARGCGGDAELQREVESLLAAHDQASVFLEESPTLAAGGHGPGRGAAQENEGTRIGRYKLLEKIGEGGFGDVWMAEQEAPMRRRVALKIIKLGMDTKEVIARFEAERQALAMMDHPNIARVFDGGATELGRPFFVMELVKGLPITEYCDEARLTTQERLELFMQVCSAVQHAHQKGIIHRDLKPSNVLVTVVDDKPAPKVIDFGIAKATQTRLTEQTLFTRFQQLIGTPAYMSPEQAGLGSQDIDTRSDIYSLGVLLYELLVGKPPFTKEELFSAGFEEMRRVIREKDPPKPSTRISTLSKEELAAAAKGRNSAPDRLRGTIRGELDWIVLKALEKDRSRRYESCGAFGQDIASYLRNEPVRACAPTASYRFEKFVQRNKTGLAVAIAFVLLLIVASIVSGWQALRANRHARESVRQARAVRETFSQSDFMVAGQLIERERPDLAVAYLCRALRSNPTNHVAAAKLLCTLAFYKFTPLLLPPLRHDGVVWTISVSTNGRRAVTLSRDWTASLWDLATGERIRHSSTGRVSKAAITPDGGKMILGMTNTIVWDAATPLAEARTLPGEFVCLSPDGAKLLTTLSDWNRTNRIQRWTFSLWDFASGARIGQSLSLTSSVYEVQAVMNGDGRQLAIALDDKVHLWRVGTNLAAGPVIATGTRLTVLTVDPEGKRVITGCGRHESAGIGYARVWNVATGEPITPELKHAASIGSALFSPDGTKIATSSWDNTARVWDSRTGEPMTHPLQHDFRVYAAHFSPDGSTVATAGEDQSIRIWDARTGKPLGAPLKHEQTGGIPAIAYTPDGSRLISASGDFTARVWNLATRRADGRGLGTNEMWRKSMTSDGRKVLAADTNGLVHVFDPFSGSESLPGLVHTGRVEAMSITPNNRFAVTYGGDRKVRTWEIASQQLVAVSSNVILGEPTPASLITSPDSTVAVTTSSGFSQIWEIPTGRELAPPIAHRWSAVITPDNSRLITSTPSDGARVWELRSGRLLRFIPYEGRGPEHIAVNRDNRSLGIGAHAQARVVDIETGSLITPNIRHRGDVTAIGFTPDGSKLITACMGGVVRVLDVKTGEDTMPELKLPSPAVSFALSGNASRIVTGAETGHMRVWDMATGEALTPFFENEHVPWLSPPDVISLDGRKVTTLSVRGSNFWRAAVWHLPPEKPTLPGWFLRFAESLANARLNDFGILERVRPEDYFSNVAALRLMNAPDENVRFAKWLIGEEAGQVSPFAIYSRQ